MNIIFGASGFAKEVNFLLTDNESTARVEFYVSLDGANEQLSGIDIISESAFLAKIHSGEIHSVDAYVGVGNPSIREKIHNKFSGTDNVLFPNAVHVSVLYDKRPGAVQLQTGNILCAGVILTTGISVGVGNHINLGCTVGHDSVLGSFNTISPGVHVSGSVTIGNRVFIGTGAVVLENVSIVDDVIIGAGSVVTKSINESGTYVGTPAKKIK